MIIWIAGILLVGIMAYITMKPSNETIVTINSKHIVDNHRAFYVAKKKGDQKGDKASDWVYYNDEGEKIRNERLMVTLFNSFKDEDWYTDFNFYVDDSKFIVETVEKSEPIEEEHLEEERV